MEAAGDSKQELHPESLEPILGGTRALGSGVHEVWIRKHTLTASQALERWEWRQQTKGHAQGPAAADSWLHIKENGYLIKSHNQHAPKEQAVKHDAIVIKAPTQMLPVYTDAAVRMAVQLTEQTGSPITAKVERMVNA